MVYVDVPGLPKDFNVKYRPPRVSLFPPSYRDRAYLRSIHRDVLRQLDLTATAAANGNGTANGAVVPSAAEPAEAAPAEPVVEKAPSVTVTEPKPEISMSGCQTIESYCYHECATHKSEKKDQKSDSKDGKNQGSNSKKQDNKKKSNDDDAHSDHEDDQHKSKHKHDKQSGGEKSKKDSKDGKDDRKDDGKFKIPDALKPFLPYPFTSSNADAFWGNSQFSKPFPEKPFTHKQDPSSWNLDYKLEAARRADEKYIWNWLGQADSATQRDAFQWLADRDAQRQARLARASHDLAGLSLDPGVGRGPPVPGAAFPNTPITPAGRHIKPAHGAGFNNSSLTAYVDQQGNIRLSDGRLVNIQGQGGGMSPRVGLFDRPQQPSGGQNHPSNGAQFNGQQQRQGWNGGQQQPFQGQQQGFQQDFPGGSQTPRPQNHQQPNGWNHNPNPGWNAPAENQNASGWNAPQTNHAQNNSNQNQKLRLNNGHWNNQAAGNHTSGGFANDHRNSNAVRFGASPNHNNDGGWGETTPNNNGWGNGNDENSKPNNFGRTNSNQNNFFGGGGGGGGASKPNDFSGNDNQNNGNDGEWDKDSFHNHGFFADGTPQMPYLDGADNDFGRPTMSGAKGTGRNKWPEPKSW